MLSSETVHEAALSAMPRQKGFRDWVGLWYEIAREKGVNDICTFAKVNTKTEAVEWFDYSHSLADGVGAFSYLLRKEGYSIPALPGAKAMKVPSLFQKLKLLAYFFRKIFQKQHIEWALKGDAHVKPEKHDFPWLIFTREETTHLKSQAKDCKISLNSLLLSCLNRVIAERLVKGNDPYLWLFPVNMRGPVKLAVDTANHSSAVALELSRRSSAQDVYNQIRYQLKTNSHWGIWWLLNIGKLIGVRGMRSISRRRNEKSFHLGTFSNMGEWPIPGSAPRDLNPDEAWVVAPPGTENFPVSCGCISWNGRLSVTLKVHPSICADRNSAAELLKKFKAELHRCCFRSG